jgi:Domain of unknown function (DUF4337)
MDFNASHALRDVAQRTEQLTSGERVLPISAAIIAVLGALATLFANHSATMALSQKNEAVLYQSKAADQYNFYEAQRIRVQLGRALIDAGVATSSGRTVLEKRIGQQNEQAQAVLSKAQSFDAQSEEHFNDSKTIMSSYELFEVAATLFQVSIVLISISALWHRKAMWFIAILTTVIGVGFFATGMLHR